MDRSPTPVSIDLDLCAVVDLEPRGTAVVAGRVRLDDLTAFLTHAYVDVAQALAAQGIPVRGPSFACYHGMHGDLTDVEAGFVVDVPPQAAGAVRAGELPGGRAVVALHRGAAHDVGTTYERMQSWMERSGLIPGRTVWEEYLTPGPEDPVDAPSVTRLVWPVSTLRLV